MEEFGLKKVKDLLCWQISMAEGYRIPQGIIDLTDKVAERYEIRIRKLDASASRRYRVYEMRFSE